MVAVLGLVEALVNAGLNLGARLFWNRRPAFFARARVISSCIAAVPSGERLQASSRDMFLSSMVCQFPAG